MKPLSLKQKQTLGILATQAYAFQDKLDLLDLPSEVQTCSKSARMEFWRQRVVMAELAGSGSAASESGSLREATNNEYLGLKRCFEVLAGESGKGFTTALREINASPTTTAPGCEYLRQLYQAAKTAGLHENYVKAIARNRFKTSDLASLSEKQLKQLMFTVNNRSSAKRGAGSSAGRNKSQREGIRKKEYGIRPEGEGEIMRQEAAPPSLDDRLDWLEQHAVGEE